MLMLLNAMILFITAYILYPIHIAHVLSIFLSPYLTSFVSHALTFWFICNDTIGCPQSNNVEQSKTSMRYGLNPSLYLPAESIPLL
jgi:hypothetical protein